MGYCSANSRHDAVGIRISDLKHECSKEDAYAFSMFRDCGIPLLSIKFDTYREVLMQANASPEVEFTQIEDEQLNTNHAVIGFYLARSWNFPKNIADLILRHHDTHALSDGKLGIDQKSLLTLSKVAANVLQQQKYAADSSEWMLVRDSVFRHFHLSDLDYAEMEADLIDHYNIINGN